MGLLFSGVKLTLRALLPRLQPGRGLCDDSKEGWGSSRKGATIMANACAASVYFPASALIGVSLAAILASRTFAADQIPDIKGKWAGKTYSIVAGSGGHWPSSKGTFEKPGLFEKNVVIEVTNQEGRRF